MGCYNIFPGWAIAEDQLLLDCSPKERHQSLIIIYTERGCLLSATGEKVYLSFFGLCPVIADCVHKIVFSIN